MIHASSRLRPLALLAMAVVAASLATTPAAAAPTIDAQGDFLPSYTGPHDLDLDVRFADVVIDPKAGTVSLSATLAGPIDKISSSRARSVANRRSEAACAGMPRSASPPRDRLSSSTR
jgi:hypothetical protein